MKIRPCCWPGSLGYPVAMKIHSRDISHKSDAGGVQLNLRTEEDVQNAYREILQKPEVL